MFDNYSKRNERRKYYKHYPNNKDRYLSGVDDDEFEAAVSDADDFPELPHINDYNDLFDWEDMY